MFLSTDYAMHFNDTLNCCTSPAANRGELKIFDDPPN